MDIPRSYSDLALEAQRNKLITYDDIAQKQYSEMYDKTAHPVTIELRASDIEEFVRCNNDFVENLEGIRGGVSQLMQQEEAERRVRKQRNAEFLEAARGLLRGPPVVFPAPRAHTFPTVEEVVREAKQRSVADLLAIHKAAKGKPCT
eukprot:gnl/Spiro4/8901_TR4701_c0_g1_i1.p1 gnl/Spiro4/8901_TR4701_c0_g1~~gnl/Spiro4/8901_TR4701_c0_g1_i1.p1  ORF type:complete len:147 (+),score=15.64 gnl/Spiro4/8901_TR4701_c0_g1_i1:63-503(+)